MKTPKQILNLALLTISVLFVFALFNAFRKLEPVAEKNSPEPVVQETSQTTNVVKTRVQPTFSDVVN